MGIQQKVSVSNSINDPWPLLIKSPSTGVKVGHVTCDNASNNKTMMKALAVCLRTATGKGYDSKKRKIKYVGS